MPRKFPTSSRGGGGGGEWTFFWGRQIIMYVRLCGFLWLFLRPEPLRPPSEHSESPCGRPHPRRPWGSERKKREAHPIHRSIYLVPTILRRYRIICAGVHNSNLPEIRKYFNALSKNFSRRHIDIFLSENRV